LRINDARKQAGLIRVTRTREPLVDLRGALQRPRPGVNLAPVRVRGGDAERAQSPGKLKFSEPLSAGAIAGPADALRYLVATKTRSVVTRKLRGL